VSGSRVAIVGSGMVGSTLAHALTRLGHEVVDFGTDSEERCDYPDFVAPAARAVASGDCDYAIVLGGSGTGEAIVANKIPGVRAALVADPRSARLSREHDDANVLVLAGRPYRKDRVRRIVKAWLAANFKGGRHLRRVRKIARLEKRLRKDAK